MTSTESTVKVAILDDYRNAALRMADWSPLAGRATITGFNDHLNDPDAVAALTLGDGNISTPRSSGSTRSIQVVR
jgi:hypothetical protein